MNYLTETAEHAKLLALHYDFEDYVRFIKGNSSEEWFGFSIKQPQIETYDMGLRIPFGSAASFLKNPPNLEQIRNNFVRVLSKIFFNYGIGNWIIRHDQNQSPWIPENWKRSPRNEDLFMFFNHLGIPNSFKGALYLPFDRFSKILPFLVGYPYLLNYRDINFLHEKEDFVVRVTHHFSIDLISKREERISELLNMVQDTCFQIIKYS